MDILKAIAKASGNEMATVMSEGTISDIYEYYDTGCLILNAQITGSMFRGIPDCKTICYSGQSTSGKTFLVIEALKNFLAKDKKDNYSVWFASEKAVTKNMLKNRGVDVKRCLFVPVGSVEEFNQQIWDILKEVQKQKETAIKNKQLEPKFMFVLDSLGQMGTVKDQKDLDEKKQKENMIRAKHVRKLFRDIEWKLAYLRIPMLFTNHVYAKTDSYIPMDVIAGGGGVMYSADIILAMRKAKLRDGDNVIGMILTSVSYKNRHAIENSKIKLEIRYKTGLSKYSGIFDFCAENKIFKEIKNKEEKEKEKSDFDKFKEKRKGKKNKTYGFAIDENTLIKFTEKDTIERPEEIYTKEFIKQLDKELQPYFNYGNEYKESVPKENKVPDQAKNIEEKVGVNTNKSVKKNTKKKRRGRPPKKKK